MLLPCLIGLAWAEEPPEIEVVGERLDPAETSASVTVIPVDARLSAGEDVASAVSRAPGAVVTRLGGLGDYTTVTIRGSTAQQVEVYLDGVPLNPEGAAAVNLAELPLRAFERIEVYRSGAPAELGGSAIGGVVNLVTGDEPRSSASAGGGSWQTARLQALAAGKARGNKDGMLAVEGFATQGNFQHLDDGGTQTTRIDDRLRERDNNDKTIGFAHARARVGTDRLRFTLLDAFAGREVGVPGPAFVPSHSARYQVLRNLLVAQVDGTREASRFQGRVYGTVRDEQLDDRQDSIGVGRQWAGTGLQSLGTSATARLAPVEWASPGVGLWLRRDQFSGRDLRTDSSTFEASRTSVTGVGFADLLLGDLVLSPAVQGLWLDNQSLVETAGVGEALPRLGLRWAVTPVVAFTGNAGQYLRPPDPTELFGDRGVIVGQPDLRPERGWQIDAGARAGADDKPLSGELVGYWRSSTDLIAIVQNAQRVGTPVNIGRARVRGLETAVGVSAEPWSLRTATSWTLSEDRSANPAYRGNQLPRIPAFELRTDAGWATDRARLGYDLSWTDGNYWDRTNWFRAAPRVLHGAFAAGRPSAKADLWLELDARNLLDNLSQVTAIDPLRRSGDTVRPLTDFVGYPLPGRTLLLTIRWEPQ